MENQLAESLNGKYLTFILDNEVYGVEVLRVKEILGLMTITRVPRMPAFVRGIINLRGKLIPVVDMREKFNLKRQEDSAKTCIIVLQIQENEATLTMGILVDAVAEVVDIPPLNVGPTPSFGSAVDTQFLLGLGKIADKVILLLNIDHTLKGSGSILSDLGHSKEGKNV